MARALTVLFRRDPSRDRENGRVRSDGYRLCWPDGRPADVGLDACCRHGQRLLGLNRHLASVPERLIEILCFPVGVLDEPMTRLPGYRVRRSLLRRRGPCGRLHFLDGTPTEITFVLGRDEASILAWIGLDHLQDGDGSWLDLAARPLDAASPRTDGPHPD